MQLLPCRRLPDQHRPIRAAGNQRPAVGRIHQRNDVRVGARHVAKLLVGLAVEKVYPVFLRRNTRGQASIRRKQGGRGRNPAGRQVEFPVPFVPDLRCLMGDFRTRGRRYDLPLRQCGRQVPKLLSMLIFGVDRQRIERKAIAHRVVGPFLVPPEQGTAADVVRYVAAFGIAHQHPRAVGKERGKVAVILDGVLLRKHAQLAAGVHVDQVEVAVVQAGQHGPAVGRERGISPDVLERAQDAARLNVPHLHLGSVSHRQHAQAAVGQRSTHAVELRSRNRDFAPCVRLHIPEGHHTLRSAEDNRLVVRQERYGVHVILVVVDALPLFTGGQREHRHFVARHRRVEPAVRGNRHRRHLFLQVGVRPQHSPRLQVPRLHSALEIAKQHSFRVDRKGKRAHRLRQQTLRGKTSHLQAGDEIPDAHGLEAAHGEPATVPGNRIGRNVPVTRQLAIKRKARALRGSGLPAGNEQDQRCNQR